MEFIKKYWWAIALVIALVVVWYVWFRKPATPKSTTPSSSSCTTSVADWNAKVAEFEAAIDGDPDWKQGVTDRATAQGVSYDERKKFEAEQMAINHAKLCKPVGA